MPSPAKITQSQYEDLAEFRFALRRFLRFSEQAAISAGVTPQQHQALLAIKGFPGPGKMTVGGLAERLQTTRHSTSGLVDRLVLEKLVKRVAAKEDRRQVFILLSAKGEKILEALSAAHRTELRQAGAEIRLLLERMGG